jgi:hypothetical protein
MGDLNDLREVRKRLNETLQHWESLERRGMGLDAGGLRGQIVGVRLAILYIDEALAEAEPK